MTIYPTFEARHGHARPYPGVVQSKLDTCVFASIAGAATYVSSHACTEEFLLQSFLNAREPAATFGSVAKYIQNNEVATIEYHDRDRPLPSYEIIIDALESGGVVILSLEHAALCNGAFARQHSWHMLSVFRALDDSLQVWDTANRRGFFTTDEFKNLVTGNEFAVSCHSSYLVPHDAHHLLIVRRS